MELAISMQGVFAAPRATLDCSRSTGNLGKLRRSTDYRNPRVLKLQDSSFVGRQLRSCHELYPSSREISSSPQCHAPFSARVQLKSGSYGSLQRGSKVFRAVAASAPPTRMQDVIEAQQFDRDLLETIFDEARAMEALEHMRGGSRLLSGFLMASLFYEPSTRTRLSFECAMRRLGGDVVTTENAREFSSAAKGETLEDSIRVVEGYADVIVIRHFESGAAKRAASAANIPIINAGDGPGQHPTQALLDVYTIQKELGRLDNINVGLVGDLANGRTARSLAYLLAKFNNVKIFLVAPEVVKMKSDIKDYLTEKGVPWEESADLLEVASACDVIYQTRIQKERFGDRIEDYELARGKYIVDTKVMAAMKKDSILMHPLPRLDEITYDVDADPRAAYFRQAKNGVHVRMAVLKLLLVG